VGPSECTEASKKPFSQVHKECDPHNTPFVVPGSFAAWEYGDACRGEGRKCARGPARPRAFATGSSSFDQR